MRWTEQLFDPFAAGQGPPPRQLGAFMRWVFAGAWPTVIFATAISVAVGATEAVAAWMIGWIVDKVSLGPEAFFAAYWPALVVAGLFFLLIRPALMILSSALVSRSLGPGLFPLAVARLHRHTLGQSLRYFEDDFTGRLAQKQVQTANAMTDVVVEVVSSFSYAFATVAGSLVVLAAPDWRLGLILAVWLLIYGGLVAGFLPQIRLRSRRRAEARAGLSGQLVDSLSHMATVKLFAHTGGEEVAALGALGRFREAALGFGRTVQAFRACLAVLGGLLPVVLVGAAFWLWSSGETGPGAIAIAGYLSMRMAQMSGWISFAAMNAFAHIGTVEDGIRTLTPPHEIVDAPEAASPGPAKGALAFENVVFRYGKEPRDLRQEEEEIGYKIGGGLDGFSLRVRPGEKVALVGRSGAGKTTVLALLLRLYDVEQGRITLDGQDIRGLAQDYLRRQVAMVTQESALFNRSARENIRYGRPEASEAEIEAAARAASAHEFIVGLRDHKGRKGYDAHLGERGVKLSGGQRQRIALARAILKDAPILALDEATAALDSETEEAVQTALERLMRDRTVIAIAHRLSTIANMDRIIVMDAGRVVEEGRHADLVQRGGLYADFWNRQSGGFLGAEAAE